MSVGASAGATWDYWGIEVSISDGGMLWFRLGPFWATIWFNLKDADDDR